MPSPRTRPVPTPDESSAHADASAGPPDLRHFGTPTRRALLAGGLAATLFSPARAAEVLTAAPLADGRLGYGAAPGPVLRGVAGQPMRLTLVNGLDARTTFAVQGLRGAGGPGFEGAQLASGERREIVFTPREAGFGLYGPWGAGAAPQWDAGLYGAIVVDGATPPAVDLDAIVVLSGDDPAAVRANGAHGPLRLSAAPGARVRLRLANAAPDLAFALVSETPAKIVAVDGQPCEPFAPADGAIPLCPSARFELTFDLGEAPARFTVRGAQRPALEIAPQGGRALARAPAPPAVADLPAAIALERAWRVTVKLTGAGPYAVNGAEAPTKPLFQVRRGEPVALTLTNQTPAAQTLRLEGHWARLLHALDDGWDPYWRDALYVDAGRTLQAAFVADAPGKWPLASASPARRAKGLAAWFVVV